MANRFISNAISYHGKGAILEIPAIVSAKGFKKAFVASDPDLVKFGVTAKVTDILDQNGQAKRDASLQLLQEIGLVESQNVQSLSHLSPQPLCSAQLWVDQQRKRVGAALDNQRVFDRVRVIRKSLNNPLADHWF